MISNTLPTKMTQEQGYQYGNGCFINTVFQFNNRARYHKIFAPILCLGTLVEGVHLIEQPFKENCIFFDKE